MIRPAEYSDLDAITRMETDGHGEKSYENFFFAQCLDFLPGGFWVKEVQSEIVGFCLFSMGTETWILDLTIGQKHRGNGYASELIRHCLDQSRQVVKLHVNPANEKAIGLYQKLGFEIVEERANYFGKGEDRLIMSHQQMDT